MPLRRYLDVILLGGTFCLLAAGDAKADAPAAAWVLNYYVELVAGLAVALIVGTGLVLFNTARNPGESFIFRMRPAFFFWLGMSYTSFLVLVAIAYNVSYGGAQPYLVGNILPIAVP